MNTFTRASAIAAAIIVTLSHPKIAFGKLVYDNDLNTQQVGAASEGSTVQVQQAYQQPDLNQVQVNRVQPVTIQRQVVQAPEVIDASQPVITAEAQPQAATRTESKSEQLRRQRMREELKNEDLLTQKLEELRLKDEMKRSEKLMSGIDKDGTAQAEAPLAEEKVGSAAVAPAPAPVQAQPTTLSAAPATSVAEIEVKDQQKEEPLNRVTITPRGGMSSITNSMYNVESKYAAGFNVSMDLSDYISFQAGYTYSSYSLSAGAAIYNPYSYNLQKLDLNDNVFDIGVRAHLTSAKQKLRPFIGAGFGYRRGYLNYDDQTLQMLTNTYHMYGNQLDDIELSAFLGYLETGLELKISDSIALSGMVRYFNVMSSSQSQPVNQYAFINPSYGYSSYAYNPYLAGGYNGYAAGGYGYGGDSRDRAGKALADNNFYQLLLGLSISF